MEIPLYKGVSTMFARLTTGVVCCLMVSSFVGCFSFQRNLIRGQSPTEIQDGTAVEGDTFVQDNTFQPRDPRTWVKSENGLPFPFNNRITDWQVNSMRRKVPGQYYCPDCYKNGEGPHWNGTEWCYEDGTPYYGWAPTHTYQHQYRIPKNLVYPDANTGAGVIVYPYYTHKGPDCFFAN